MATKKPPMKKAPAKSAKGKGKMSGMGMSMGGGKSCPSCGAPMFARGTKCYACGTKK